MNRLIPWLCQNGFVLQSSSRYSRRYISGISYWLRRDYIFVPSVWWEIRLAELNDPFSAKTAFITPGAAAHVSLCALSLLSWTDCNIDFPWILISWVVNLATTSTADDFIGGVWVCLARKVRWNRRLRSRARPLLHHPMLLRSLTSL